MKVVVDANPVYRLSSALGPTGVGRYTRGAIDALAHAAPDWEILAVACRQPAGRPGDFEGLAPNVRLINLPMSVKAYQARLLAGVAPKVEGVAGKVDASIGTNFVPMPSRGSLLPVVYDLSFFRYPETISTRNRIFLQRLVPRSIRRAARIITISQQVKDEISSRFDVAPDSICIAYPGVDHLSSSAERALPDAVPDEYLLFVGTLEPRKNLAGAIEAHRLASSSADVPPLVVVGGSGWRTSSIRPVIERAEAEGTVVMLGYVEDGMLPALYSGAKATIMVSLYEGFGMPIAEAQLHGCPVVASDRPAMREAGGDAAIYVDPEDPGAIASAINNVLSSPPDAAKIKASAQRFTWQRTGAALREAVELAVG